MVALVLQYAKLFLYYYVVVIRKMNKPFHCFSNDSYPWLVVIVSSLSLQPNFLRGCSWEGRRFVSIYGPRARVTGWDLPAPDDWCLVRAANGGIWVEGDWHGEPGSWEWPEPACHCHLHRHGPHTNNLSQLTHSARSLLQFDIVSSNQMLTLQGDTQNPKCLLDIM